MAEIKADNIETGYPQGYSVIAPSVKYSVDQLPMLIIVITGSKNAGKCRIQLVEYWGNLVIAQTASVGLDCGSLNTGQTDCHVLLTNIWSAFQFTMLCMAN